MSEARITVSTVAVGPSADPELLKNLAQWGKGRAYAVADAAQVPEIYRKLVGMPRTVTRLVS